MPVSKRLRYEILRRDNHACRYCGATAPDATLTVDHVLAVALGGKDDPSNLVTACRDCNSGKSATPADAAIVGDVQQDAIRWSAAIRRATETALIERDKVNACAKEVWDILDYAERFLPVAPSDSIEQFMRNGLDAEEITDAAYSALGATHISAHSVWKYFCGICWRKIERRHEAARQLVEAEQPAKRGGFVAEKDMAYKAYFGLSNICDGNPLREAGII